MSAPLLALAFGLATALCFGTGDFLASRLTRRHGWLSSVFAIQVVAGVMLAGAGLGGWGIPRVGSAQQWMTVALIGVVNTLGLIALYRAFGRGKVSIVSPIAGSMGAFTVAFAWLGGLPPAPDLLPGMLAMLAGIALASVTHETSETGETGDDAKAELDAPPSTLRRARGVGWALASALAFGWVFFALGPSSEALGPAWVVCSLRLVAVALLVPLSRLMRTPLRAEMRELRRASTPLLLVVAVCDGGGMLTFAYASSRPELSSEIALLTVLASCFPVMTIMWARLGLRESLAWWQWLGVSLVVASIAWISACSEVY